MPKPAPAVAAPNLFFRRAVSGVSMWLPVGCADAASRERQLYTFAPASKVRNAGHRLIARGIRRPHLDAGAVGGGIAVDRKALGMKNRMQCAVVELPDGTRGMPA